MNAADKPRPKVSIVMAVLNGAKTLHETIASVTAQDYPNTEYIVVDGGSTDGTLALLAEKTHQVDLLLTGPDSGIAEAMNKGVAHASGDLVMFLHADDRFVDAGALSAAMAEVDDLSVIWAFGVMFGASASERVLRPRTFNAWTRFKNPLPHQGVLCPRHLLEQIGGFDQALQICVDYDFFLRAYLGGVKLQRRPQLLARMGDSGISSRRDWGGLNTRFAEEREIHQSHSNSVIWQLAYALYWPLYLAYRRLLSLCGRRK